MHRHTLISLDGFATAPEPSEGVDFLVKIQLFHLFSDNLYPKLAVVIGERVYGLPHMVEVRHVGSCISLYKVIHNLILS